MYLAFDDQDPERLEKLNRLAAEAISDPTTEWELTRYLNFFELVAGLCKRGELTREDVLLVFDYPLRRLAGQREIVGYLKPNGYGALDEFLSKNRQA